VPRKPNGNDQDKNPREASVTTRGRVVAGLLAQILGQAVASWGLMAHLAGWPDVSIWMVAPVGAAILVPFRHDGTPKQRAIGNFGSAAVVSGMLWWEVLIGGFEGILGGGGITVGPVAMFMLAATVLFTLAGAMFWVVREDHP
jgi:hypothetical protein